MRNLFEDEIAAIGLKSVGKDVKIADTVTFINPQYIEIRDRARIDMGVLISAGPEGVLIGRNVHIASYVLVFGGGARCEIQDFVGLSAMTRIYTASDDFTDTYLSCPTFPDEFRKVTTGAVIIEKACALGTGTVVLHGVRIGEASSAGANSVVTKDVPPASVVVGSPARVVRTRDLAALQQRQRDYLSSIGEISSEDTRAINEALFDKLVGPQKPESIWRAILTLRWIEAWRRWKQLREWQESKRLAQKANDDVNAWTRQKMRSEGFSKDLMPRLPIPNDELDRKSNDH